MSKLYSSDEIILVLERNNYYFRSQKGSHGKFKNSNGRIVVVPMNKKGSSDKCVPRFVNSINPEFEELHIPETVCLTLHCFYLIVYTLQRSC